MLVVTGADAIQESDAPWPAEVNGRGASARAEMDARLTAQMSTIEQLLQTGFGARVQSLSRPARAAAQQRAIATFRTQRVPDSCWARGGG